MTNEQPLELPSILDNRELLLKKIREAGGYNLQPGQLAIYLKVDRHKLHQLMITDPAINDALVEGKLAWEIAALDVIKQMAITEGPHQFSAAKLAYEIFAGLKNRPQTVIAIQNLTTHGAKHESNMKLIESLDAETVEAIKND